MFVSYTEPGAAPERRGRRGIVLLTAAAMVFLILLPVIGLSVDVGVLYLVQVRLAAASDAASLAGARALARGIDDSAQRTNAENTGDAYFLANFPPGYFGTTNLYGHSAAATDSTYMRSITTTSHVDVPFLFLRMVGRDHIRLTASAKATRRDVNIMIVMDRSGSLAGVNCTALKAAAVNFVNKFAEGRDYLGLITFATSSRVDVGLTMTFKTTVTSTLNSVTCTGATNSAQALWEAYVELAGMAQAGALNVIVFFTDGLPTAVTETFPILTTSPCTPLHAALPLVGVITLASSAQGLYTWAALAQPQASDIAVIADNTACKFYTSNDATKVTTDVAYAPPIDYWGNALKPANNYLPVTTSGAGFSIATGANVQNFSTNAADNAGFRIRSGAPDIKHASRTLAGVTIFSIGLGASVDAVLLKRIAYDKSLVPNPVAAGNQGLYVYAANATELDQAFTRVASEMLRLAQ